MHAAVSGAPDDPQYTNGNLWGLADILAPSAWGQTTGTRDVVVGVVDTGIDYTHPDLAANVWANPGGIGGCPAGTHGYNATKNSCDPLDDNSHGSHVSGTIGAVGNNGTGVVGVNWTVSLMALKFLDSSGTGTTRAAIKAIDFAVQATQAGVNVRVLNNSWGGAGFSKALLDEINKANGSGILFVAAAGNGGTNDDTAPFYPASYDAANVVSVAATDQADGLLSLSNYGPASVDLGAPGLAIWSTVRGGSYAAYSGTSMAAAQVSGAAALILSTSPSLSASQLKTTILSSVSPDPALAGKTATGGRLNVCKAIPACVTP